MHDPPRVLLITPPGSYRVHAYLEAARDLGLDMVVASEGEHSLVLGLDGGIRVDLGDSEAVVEQVLAVYRDRPIAAVVATDDATVEVANRAAAALGARAQRPFRGQNRPPQGPGPCRARGRGASGPGGTAGGSPQPPSVLSSMASSSPAW